LREYLNAHRYGNASWPDLIAVLGGRTGEDLAAWSRAWVEEAGRPVVTTSRVRAEGTDLAVTFTQEDPVEARGLTWSQRIRLAVGDGRREQVADGRIAGRESLVRVPQSTSAGLPRFVLPTGGGIAYGDFVLDDGSRRYLIEHLAEVRDPLTRGAALVTLWEEMLDGRVPAQAVFAAILAALPRETDELTVQRLLAYADQAFWKFLPSGEREARAPGLERMLRSGLARAATPGLKSAWFNALRSTARGPDTIAWLERVWRRTESVPGLTLAEPDYMTLALELAVRQVPAWQEVLDTQLARIENPDRKAQFEFVRPALSADAAVRDAFFAGLADPANRRREAWVLQAVSYLHHPLRAAESEKYIPVSLELLRELQRTGDIFFPKRWTDATLGGHRSPSAAHMVNVFLENVPKDYPDRLRRIVLSSADGLFRASRVQAR
jgi:aminopeptidase N